ncbi:MAG: hypothetical protein ABI425_06030 [Patescibacteria group bacterium]
MTDPIQNPAIIPESDKRFKNGNPLLLPAAFFAIYFMIIPLVFLDICTTLYQLIYFSALGIPKISKRQFIVMERWDLNKLNFWQKINCVYCEYANGLLAWAKAVGNQTEIYSCAIRHQHALKGHEHEKKFYDPKKFE